MISAASPAQSRPQRTRAENARKMRAMFPPTPNGPLLERRWSLRVPPESEEDIAALNRPAAISAVRVKAYLEQVLADWPDRFPLPR